MNFSWSSPHPSSSTSSIQNTRHTLIIRGKKNKTVFYKFNNWIEANIHVLLERKLYQITLPGSHEAPTHHLTDIVSPDAEDVVKSLSTGVLSYPTRSIIKKWAKCQSMSLYNQLIRGIRYIDLRVCLYKGEFYTRHSLLGHSIPVLLAELVQFVERHPYEFILFSYGGYEGFSKNTISQLEKTTRKLLGKHYNHSWTPNSTVKQILESGSRILVNYKRYGDQIIHDWPNTRCPKTMLKKLTTSPRFTTHKLYEVQLILTPCRQGIIDGIISPWVSPTSTYQYAKLAHKNLKKYIEWANKHKFRPQIIETDFFEESTLIQDVILWNITWSPEYCPSKRK